MICLRMTEVAAWETWESSVERVTCNGRQKTEKTSPWPLNPLLNAALSSAHEKEKKWKGKAHRGDMDEGGHPDAEAESGGHADADDRDVGATDAVMIERKASVLSESKKKKW